MGNSHVLGAPQCRALFSPNKAALSDFPAENFNTTNRYSAINLAICDSIVYILFEFTLSDY